MYYTKKSVISLHNLSYSIKFRRLSMKCKTAHTNVGRSSENEINLPPTSLQNITGHLIFHWILFIDLIPKSKLLSANSFHSYLLDFLFRGYRFFLFEGSYHIQLIYCSIYLMQMHLTNNSCFKIFLLSYYLLISLF